MIDITIPAYEHSRNRASSETADRELLHCQRLATLAIVRMLSALLLATLAIVRMTHAVATLALAVVMLAIWTIRQWQTAIEFLFVFVVVYQRFLEDDHGRI